MAIQTDVRNYLDRLTGTLERLPAESIERLSDLLYRAYTDGQQVFILGNGGSASNPSGIPHPERVVALRARV